MVGDLGEELMNDVIPIPNVNAAVLKKVIEWCTHHKDDVEKTADEEGESRKKSTEIDEWDQKFMQVDQEMLFEIILVSTFYPLPSSTQLTCLGCQLSRYQGSARCRLQDCCQHDQGQVSRRDPKDVQHSERLYS